MSNSLFPALFDLKVYECPWMTEWRQVRFPRSKKRRIRKKWAKQHRNYGSVPSNEIVQMATAIYMHPATWQKIKRKINKEQQDG